MCFKFYISFALSQNGVPPFSANLRLFIVTGLPCWPVVAAAQRRVERSQQMQQKGVTVCQLVQFLTSGLDPEKPIVRQACDHFQLPQV